jgi:Leucine-rich repeat (LRR) protein
LLNPCLQTLDLTNNGLIQLQGHALPMMTSSLTSLLLANNGFQSLPLRDLDLYTNLTVLDLSLNVITTLTKEERGMLDSLAVTRPFA